MHWMFSGWSMRAYVKDDNTIFISAYKPRKQIGSYLFTIDNRVIVINMANSKVNQHMRTYKVCKMLKGLAND